MNFFASGETNISATPYRSFVGKHPNQRTYFLPVLDALEYKPSQLSLAKPSIIVEGKADFAFFTTSWKDADYSFCALPGNGAKSFDPLIGILTGWAVPFLIVVDDDKEGRQAKASYIKAWNLDETQVRTIADFDPTMANKSLEEVVQDEIGDIIKLHFGITTLQKCHVQNFLYEQLALGLPFPTSARLNEFADNVAKWGNATL